VAQRGGVVSSPWRSSSVEEGRVRLAGAARAGGLDLGLGVGLVLAASSLACSGAGRRKMEACCPWSRGEEKGWPVGYAGLRWRLSSPSPLAIVEDGPLVGGMICRCSGVVSLVRGQREGWEKSLQMPTTATPAGAVTSLEAWSKPFSFCPLPSYGGNPRSSALDRAAVASRCHLLLGGVAFVARGVLT
jgi:hypothetical protein